jgi:hypothetical protein
MNRRDRETKLLIEQAQAAVKAGQSRVTFVGLGTDNRTGAGKAYDIAKAMQLASDPGAFRTQLRPGKTVEEVIMSPANSEGKRTTLKQGLGATLCAGSDRYAYTLVGWTANGEIIYVTKDKATRTDKNGQSEDQTYSYETQKEALPEKAVWSRQQKRYRLSGMGLYLGVRKEYSDPGF